MPFSTVCRQLAGSLFIILPLLVAPFYAFAQTAPIPTDPHDTLRILAEEEQRRTMDPALGRVPYERLEEARQQLLTRKAAGGPQTSSAIPNVTWQERGPSNAGGRTRTLLFDPNDATHKKVWAASPAGGLWYTNDITDANAGWTPVSDSWESLVITALAADPSNPQIMYAGTGDYYSGVSGGGIWKTTNGGTSWSRLSSTIPGGNSPALSRAFDYIQLLVVSSSGQVFAATQYGVARSTDGGITWSYALAPNQGIGNSSIPTNNYYNDKVTDLEIGTDGILYGAFYPSRVFRSSDASGTSWTEITPPGISGDRTELALAPSTSGSGQVLYGVSRAYNSMNYGQDVKWFKKSTNGGVSWSDMTIPTNGGSHFTNGGGSSNMTLSVHPSNPNTVYAGGYDWFSSTNGGASWSSQMGISTKCQGLWFQPGSQTTAILASDGGVMWFADWVNVLTNPPTIASRNNGYRVGEVSSVSMKNSQGSSFLLAGIQSNGYSQLTTPGLSAGTQIYGVYYPGTTFIDEDDPTLQLFQAYGSFYRYNSSNSTQLTSLNSYYSTAAADYNSPSNTLYVADFTNNQGFLRRITNVATNPQSTTAPLTGFNTLATYLKLSPDGTKLYLGTSSGKVYKVSDLGQSTPTIMAIDNGALPQYFNVSCIDVGADDNELLVTLSNFGAQSVWYTNNGGQTWIGKDQSNYGLPDMPIRTALFNPQNRKQVLLGTELGVWSTNDITATNPGWTPTTDGLGTIRINQLRYRPSDGRMAAATSGRGVFTSDAFAIPYTLPTITLTGISNATLCAGSTFTVSFTKSGPAMGSNNKYEVWISDANGDFSAMKRIGSSTDSPVIATLPSSYNALPYGTNYRVKVIATDPEVESGMSDALAIGNLNYAYIINRYNDGYTSVTVFPNRSIALSNRVYDYTGNIVTPEQYQWTLNGNTVAGATGATYTTTNPGTYGLIIGQAGCSINSSGYTVYNSVSPTVTINTDALLLCQGNSAKVISSYAGNDAVFQWTRNGVDITGATSYSYLASATGLYAYRMQDGPYSATAQGQYIQAGQSLPSFIRFGTAADSVRCAGSTYSTYMTLSGSSSSYSYQWKVNGTPIAGANYNNYYAYGAGAYSVTIKQNTCETSSNTLIIKAAASSIPVSINYTGSTSLCAGESRTLNALSISGVSYQWQKDGVDISGATNSYLSVNSTGSYTVRATQVGCSGVSNAVRLQFGNTFVTKLITYNSGTCTPYFLYYQDGVNLSGYTYQWQRNGIDQSGATASFYSVSIPGAYTLRITNGTCSGTTKPYYAAIGQSPKPNITPELLASRCAGGSVRLSSSLYYDSYQWKRNGVAIPFAQTSTYFATESGLYSLAGLSGSCSIESDPVEIKIGEPTTAQLTGNALVSSGTTAQLPISFTGPAPWSFTLTTGQSVQNTYQNPYLLAVAPTTTTTYALASVMNACGTGTVAGNAVVTVGTGQADVSLSMAFGNRTPKLNDLVDVLLTLTNAGPQEAVGLQTQSRLPAGLEFVESSSPGVSAANGLVTANAGTLAVNGVTTLSFRARVTQPGTLATAAQVTAAQTPDPDSQPNSGTGDGQDDTAQADLRTADASGPLLVSANPNQIPIPRLLGNQPTADPTTADLSLALSTNAISLKAGDIVSATLTVSNRGGSAASSVVVQTVLPVGWSLGSSAGLVISGQTVKGYINQLGAGQSATIVLPIRVGSSGGLLQAQILDMGETDPDSIPGNGYQNGEDDEATTQIRVR